MGVEQDLVTYVIVVMGLLVLLLYVACWGLSLLALIKGRLYLHVKSDPTLTLDNGVPGVSIVKVMAGVDPLLEARLDTHFSLTYPRFELLFCFQDDQDPAIAVVKRLQVKYPKVPVRLLCNRRQDIPNPLLQSLVQGYEAANYDYVWVCSNKIQVTEDALGDMVRRLQPDDVGLVHQLPFSLPAPHTTTTTATTVQQVYYGCAVGRYYVAFNLLGMCCVSGMSYMLKRSALEQQKQQRQQDSGSGSGSGSYSSLSAYGHCMPHDFFVAKDLHTRGYKTVMSSFPAEENRITPLCDFADTMIRWTRLRLSVLTLVAGVLEPLSQCFPLGVLTSGFLFLFFDIRPMHFLFCHVLAWLAVDLMMLRIVQRGPQKTDLLHAVYSWFLCQALCVWVWIKALSAPHRIRWGPHAYHLHFGGRLQSTVFTV